MTELITNFHFLRPFWLLALLPAVAVWWLIFRSAGAKRQWERWVDPELLDGLLVQGGRQQLIRPLHLLGFFWLLTVLALAGPSWQREPSPFAEDKAALVIVLKVTPSMKETDIAPSRLQRAAQKISDLLAARPGARNSLIAYAGSAHLVMPLTTDANVINVFAEDLSPQLMPEEGDDPVAALSLAERQLSKTGQPGTILFITDALDKESLTAMGAHRKNGGAPIHIWAAVADPPPTLKQAADAGGGSFAVITPDPSDVERLARDIQKTATSDIAGLGETWRDGGYGFLPVLVVIGAFGFRRGWVVGHE
jgi:Ca-activated chloride channel family protein